MNGVLSSEDQETGLVERLTLTEAGYIGEDVVRRDARSGQPAAATGSVASAVVGAALSMSSINEMGALSPRRGPNFTIRV
jgi:hypothetical protein